MPRVEGGCFCGAIRYRVTGPLAGAAACHCRKCQYGSGGGPNYVALAQRAAFEVTRGTPTAHRSRADSGSEVARVFCAACGTPLWSDGPNLPFLAVRVGSLDDAPAGGPALHIWTEAAPRWHAFEPSAVVFPQGPVAAAPS